MNPNSLNQLWSKWTFDVTPGKLLDARSHRTVVSNCARFGRKAFGSASQMRVTQKSGLYLVEIITEGHPVHDLKFVQFMRDNWTAFFLRGFGVDTQVTLDAKLLAGSRQDGSPRDQWVQIPTMPCTTRVKL